MHAVEVISAEAFTALALAHSSSGLRARQPGGVASVRAASAGGSLYTVFAMQWWNQVRCTIEAYRLVEGHAYAGPTTIDAFDAAVIRSEYASTDFTGLLVDVEGKQLVCAERRAFEMGLPAGPAMCFGEAIRYSEAQGSLGWRRRYRGIHAQLFSRNGHPVYKYEDPSTGHCDVVLLWKWMGMVSEIRLDRATKLDGVPEAAICAIRAL